MSNPVQTQWINIAPGFAGYLALPPARRGPGLLLWQEIFGVNEHIRAVAEQYALAGFVVLAPDAFWRQAPRVELGYEGADRQQAMALMQAYTATEHVLADTVQAVAALRARSEVAGKVGSLGYCLGGRLAYLTAATTDIDAAVPFYGGGIQGQLDLAAAIRCPVQFHYAEQDDHIPLDAVERVRAALPAPRHELHVYPGAHHGFNCWARGSYHPASAALAHGRALSFLSTQLFG
jgi:carboxymethylenebutenolidase